MEIMKNLFKLHLQKKKKKEKKKKLNICFGI